MMKLFDQMIQDMEDFVGMYITDDPVADAYRRDKEQEEWLESRPVCKCCGEHIQTEFYYELPDGLWCEDCIMEGRHYTEDWEG